MTSLTVQESSNGKGVFALQKFHVGEVILQCRGQRLDRSEIVVGSYIHQHSLQIGEDTFLSPSGGIDDYVNHSCNPNSGYQILNEKVYLIAIRDVEAGEEIHYDYSTYMTKDSFEMKCHCGSVNCRGSVKNFTDLPAGLQKQYVHMGVVPEYISKNLKSTSSIQIF